jgi:hypothetical protein
MRTMFKPSVVSFIVIFILIASGCKQEKSGNLSADDKMQVINYDSLHAELATSNLQNGGANIFLEIINPDALFNSNDPSYIQKGNPNLAYIKMISNGRSGDSRSTNQDTTAKDFISNVYVGKTVAWILKPKSRDKYKFHFQEVDFGEGTNPDNGNEPCNAFTIKRGKPETGGQNQGAIITQVIDNPELEHCEQSYTLIFAIENKDGQKRWFTLDPWVLIRN